MHIVVTGERPVRYYSLFLSFGSALIRPFHQGTADTLISLSSADIAGHANVSVEEMIENLINSD